MFLQLNVKNVISWNPKWPIHATNKICENYCRYLFIYLFIHLFIYLFILFNV